MLREGIRGRDCKPSGLTPSMIDTLTLIAREPENVSSKAYSDFDNTMDRLFNSNRNKARDYDIDY